MAKYERWLIARGNVFAPSSAAVAKLIEKLRVEKWILDPKNTSDLAKLRFHGKQEEMARRSGAYAVKTVENTFDDDADAKLEASTEALPAAITAELLDDPDREELRLVWPVDVEPGTSPPVNYPLTLTPESNVRWSLEIHRALEYVYPVSDSIKPLPSECKCGEDLSFEWDEDEVVPAFRAATGIFAECDECSRTFDPAKEVATIKNPFDGSKEKMPGGAAYRFAIKVDCGDSFVADAKLAFAPALVELVEKEFGRSFYQVGSLY